MKTLAFLLILGSASPALACDPQYTLCDPWRNSAGDQYRQQNQLRELRESIQQEQRWQHEELKRDLARQRADDDWQRTLDRIGRQLAEENRQRNR